MKKKLKLFTSAYLAALLLNPLPALAQTEYEDTNWQIEYAMTDNGVYIKSQLPSTELLAYDNYIKGIINKKEHTIITYLNYKEDFDNLKNIIIEGEITKNDIYEYLSNQNTQKIYNKGKTLYWEIPYETKDLKKEKTVHI